MAQQPNIEITAAEKPRTRLEPGHAVKWRSTKPGMPDGPDGVAGGGYFGTTGPDPGWGLKILAEVELPDDDPRLHDVVAGLMLARAAALGRAPVPEDIEVALILCGFGYEPPTSVVEARERWLEAAAHDRRPGATAVGEVDRNVLVLKPESVIATLRAR